MADSVEFMTREQLKARVRELESAIRHVVTARGDDLCWMEIYTELALLIGIKFRPSMFENSEHMLENCKQFICSLKQGSYTPIYTEKTNG